MKTSLSEGNRLFKNGYYDEAIKQYKESIKKWPDLRDILEFNINLANSKVNNKILKINNGEKTIKWGIMTPGHTSFVAFIISEQLKLHGWSVEILSESPQNYNHDYYIVIAHHIYKSLPPGEKRIVFQLEQSVSSRWFTKEYLEVIKNSLCVLDYSLNNIKFLADQGIAYPLVHYLPIGININYGQNIDECYGKKYDVLFYGDSLSSERRRIMLDALKEKFDVFVINNMFGDDMVKVIRQSKVVVNIHYYENAILEMPRIQECLSLGVNVVSESTNDQSDYPEICDSVLFFESGSIDSMLSAVGKALQIENSNISISQDISAKKFKFLFDRFLIAIGLLPTTQIECVSLPISSNSNVFGLSMPETISRRLIFQETKPNYCEIFDGFRRSPGWVGCGLSYAALANHALKNNIKHITIMEDDVILPNNFDSDFKLINEFLESISGEWDVFSGLIAVLHPDAKIISVKKYQGKIFITIDKMTSTVFNIYAQDALEMFSMWDSTNLDPIENTIDKYLESQKSIKVVTTLPYFVGHREEVISTLWNFQNSQYNELIEKSEILLQNKLKKFLADGGDIK